MKDEWKVFIQGVPGRGDEVIKALTDLGAKESFYQTGTFNSLIYYIRHNGIIDSVNINGEFANIIKDNYKEIKLPKKWKDGDILIRKDNNNIFCVYQKPVDNGKGFLCHVYVTKDILFAEVTVPTDPADNYRKATDSEKLTFYSLIDNHHMRWNAEKKQLVDWKPADKEELLDQWKNGDILISKDGTDYKVFWEYDSDSNTQFYAYNVSMRVNGMLSRYIDSIWHEEKIQRFREDYRLATPSEVEHFHELLHNLNRDWDSEKKEIVDWKWKPKKNEKYWFISFSGNIIEYIWTDSPDDKTCFNFGNCFHTREEAKAMAEKINKLLNE